MKRRGRQSGQQHRHQLQSGNRFIDCLTNQWKSTSLCNKTADA